MSLHTAQKATRLLAEGKVRPLNASLTLFEVEGETGVYIVKVRPSCDCQAGQAGKRCSHLEAAEAWVNAKPDEQAMMRAILDAKSGEAS